MASTNYSASGATGVIDSYIKCDVGSSKITLRLFVRRKDSTASIDGTYSVSGDSSDSGTYVLSSSYTEIWSDEFNEPSGDTLNVNLNFTIKATSPSAGLKTVNATLTKVYLDDDEGGSSSGGSGSSSYDVSYLWVLTEVGTNIFVKRTYTAIKSENNGSYIGDLKFNLTNTDEYGTWKGCKIWYKDRFEISTTVSNGYTLDTYQEDEHTFNFGVSALEYREYDNVWEYVDIDGSEAAVYVTATPNTYKLSIPENVGANITVRRVSTNNENASTNATLKNGDPIYHDDQLEITCSANTGYNLSSIKIGSSVIENGSVHTVSGDITITVTTEVKSYSLTLNPDTGVTINVNRTSSPLKGAANKTFTSSEFVTYKNEIYYGDELTITFSSSTGYKIEQQLVNQEFFTSGSSHTVSDDVEVTAITDLSGIVHIFNGSVFDDYVIYIFNGQNWNDQYIPYIFDGTNWVICS